jgi:hypothetical protein
VLSVIEIMGNLIQRILRKVRSDKILSKIDSGKMVYFENTLEEIAFKYIPGGVGKFGKYYAKHYNQDEFEMQSDSTSIQMAVMEGRQISRARYNNYHLIKGVYWDRDLKYACDKQNYKRYLVNG